MSDAMIISLRKYASYGQCLKSGRKCESCIRSLSHNPTVSIERQDAQHVIDKLIKSCAMVLHVILCSNCAHSAHGVGTLTIQGEYFGKVRNTIVHWTKGTTSVPSTPRSGSDLSWPPDRWTGIRSRSILAVLPAW